MSWNPRGVVIFSPSGAFFPDCDPNRSPACALKRPPAPARLPPRRGAPLAPARRIGRPRARRDDARHAVHLQPSDGARAFLSPLASRTPTRLRSRASSVLGRVASSLAAPDANPPSPRPAGRPSRRRDPPPHTRTPRCLRRPRRHPDEHPLHLCPARWFHGQLPIGSGRHGFLTGVPPSSARSRRSPTPSLLAHANAQLWEQPGYFYVIQIDPTRLPDVEGFEAADEGRWESVGAGAVGAEAVRASSSPSERRTIPCIRVQRLSAVIGENRTCAPTRAMSAFYRLLATTCDVGRMPSRVGRLVTVKFIHAAPRIRPRSPLWWVCDGVHVRPVSPHLIPLRLSQALPRPRGHAQRVLALPSVTSNAFRPSLPSAAGRCRSPPAPRD